MQKNKKYIFFYSHLDRHFRSTLIGHLYLLMKEHNVILFSDNLKKETLSILNNTNLFPRLKIVNLYHSNSKNIFIKNFSEFKNNAKIFDQSFKKYHCKSLIASSDWHSLNELYLMRIAKNMKIFRFSIQESVHWNTKLRKEWVFIEKKALYPKYLSSKFARFIFGTNMFFKYLFFQFLIPISSFRKPFLTKKTFFLWNGAAGCNDSEYHIVFSKFEYEQYKISGTDINKLKIVPHPFTLDKLNPLKNILFRGDIELIDFLIILDSTKFSFKKNKSIISKEIKLNNDVNVIKNLAQKFSHKKIIVKPHPDSIDYIFFKERLKSFKNVDFADSSTSVESFFESTYALIGFSPSFSTTSIYFKLFYPNKKSIAINLLDEYNGNFFQKNKYDIHYVESMEDLDLVLSNKKEFNALNNNFNFNFEDINQFLNEKLP